MSMEYTQETINELLNKIGIAINNNNATFNNKIKKIFINRTAFVMIQKSCYRSYCYGRHIHEGYDMLFGYPAQVYYDNKDEPEFYLGI